MPRIADIVAQTLHAHGIRHAFGMPGGEVVTLIDALGEAGIRFILNRHETAAAIMAAGASETTGAPGLLVTTLGPGLTNAVNGIADASQEHVPLVVISGAVEHGIRGRYTHQILDQATLMRPLVKGCFEIEPKGAGPTIARAVRLAMRPPMGPVFVQIAPDTAALSAGDRDHPVRPARSLTTTPDLQSGAIREAVRLIEGAKRPIVLAGVEAVRDYAGEALLAVMERRNIPLITTYKAKGLVDETHPFALGGAGLSPLADKTLLPLLRAADLVLLLGYDPIEMRIGWVDPFGPDAEVIEISACPADHGMHAATATIDASPRAFLTALFPALAEADSGASWPNEEPQRAKAELGALFAPPGHWGPHDVIAAMEEALPPDAVVTVDSGAHRILLSQQLRVRKPLGLLQSAGFCTMGAAIPLAGGAKAARPDAPAIAVLGDGGLEMGLGELATLRHEDLPVIIVVFQDESLALIEMKQAQAGLNRAGVRLGASRFEDVAEALGGRSWRVKSRDSFEAAFAAALQERRFTLIICEIQVSDYAGKF